MAKGLQELRDAVAANLSAALLDAGLTQKDLSEHLKVGRATVSNWCTGVKKPRTETLIEISEALRVPLNFLIESGPFEYWPILRKDLPGFFQTVQDQWGAERFRDIAHMLYGIDPDAPERTPLSDLAYFINDNFSRIERDGDRWIISSKTEAPAPVTEDQRSEIQSIFDQLPPAKQEMLLELAYLYLNSQRKTEETE